MSDRTPADAPHVIEVEWDSGYAEADQAFRPGDLIFLSLPCPGARTIRGGVGGQMITECPFCGEVMASTAGPHSVDGRYYKPVVVEDHSVDGQIVSWRPFHPDLIGEIAAGFRVVPIPDDNTRALAAGVRAIAVEDYPAGGISSNILNRAAAYLDGQPEDRPAQCPTCGSDKPAVCLSVCASRFADAWHVGGSGDTQ